MKIELNTDLLPVLSVGMYESILSIDNLIEREFDGGEYTDEERECMTDSIDMAVYKNAVKKFAMESMKEFFRDICFGKEGYVIELLDGKIWSPRYYNYKTDTLDYTVEISEFVLGKIIVDAIRNDKFWAWADQRYRSYDGHICFMPRDKVEFMKLVLAGEYDRVVAAYLTYIGFIYGCDYTYDIYENLSEYGLGKFLNDEKAQAVLTAAYERS